MSVQKPIDAAANGDLSESQQRNKHEFAAFFKKRVASLDIVKTTSLPDGRLIDWIPIESQGVIAKTPVQPKSKVVVASDPEKPTFTPIADLEAEGVDKGPPGTVPVMRQGTELLNHNMSLKGRLSKQALPPHLSFDVSNAGAHWYAAARQSVPNTGGIASYSVFKPFVTPAGYFSLIQTAVVRNNVPFAGAPGGRQIQTIEAGWINYPGQLNANHQSPSQPHLFTFFTTNGYQGVNNGNSADNIQGWNQEVQGFIQTDNTYVPGTQFSPLSTRGGQQYELQIEIKLINGDWHIWVIDRFIGYYPGSLFSQNGLDPNQSLSTAADEINFYGEIAQAEAPVTTSDMGSGAFASAGFGNSAFIHNMSYFDSNGNPQDFDGSAQVSISDPNRYTLDPHFNSGSTWASYMYLGGPGAGGVIDG